MPDYEKLFDQNSKKYQDKIRKNYIEVINEVSNLSTGLSLNPNNEFYFRNYSEVNAQVNKLILELNSNVRGGIVEGVNTSWDIANEKNDALTRELFGVKLSEINSDIRIQYLSNNYGARQEFLRRKINGLGISDRVWTMSKQFKSELELALEYSIGQGKSAAQVAGQIKGYLNEPDRLYRRVRETNGVLRLSKNAKAYTPGKGVYRSSYQNALRLSRNENNFAYRAANYEKVKKCDFITGIKVNTTPSWSPEVDKGGIDCGALSGVYPPSYNFRGNHINCRCYTTNILKTDEELQADTDSMVSGGNPIDSKDSSNYIGDYQPFYKKYIKENKEKWDNYKNKPLFLQG